MVNQVRMIIGSILDPWLNLAYEEYLLNTNPPDTAVLYLWQNDHTVVIGRNQNPYQECNLSLMEQEGIKLARRISGGGAVYHDIGNLNFSFILNKSIYDIPRQCRVIIDALDQLGLKAEQTGRNDITLEGRKFSGNAFCYRGQNALHHGTILIQSDMEKLARYLNVSQKKMSAKGVTSVKSRVINLSEALPGITVETVKEVCMKAFSKSYGDPEAVAYVTDSNLPENDLIRSLQKRNSSWEWQFGNTPVFDFIISERFGWGCVELGITVECGIISECAVYSDALCEDLILTIPLALKGVKFEKSLVLKHLEPTFSLYSGLDMDYRIKDEVLGDIRRVVSGYLNVVM